MVTIWNETLEAQFTTFRAELIRLRDVDGRDFLWNGNPEVWKGHSPVLFPIVGMVPDNIVTINGKDYPLGQHGFAPLSEFTIVDLARSSCTFRLEADEKTRNSYPFDFRLDIRYTLSANTLSMAAAITNHSTDVMPFSFGFHPGFCWPLPEAGARESHFLEFEKTEDSPIRRPLNGLLDPIKYANPIEGRALPLHDELFELGAVMFDEISSRQVRFGTDRGPYLDVRWTNLPHLGIWTKPGANYLCIEPWQGMSALPDFKAELSQKPGILLLEPGNTQEFAMLVTVVDRPTW